MLLNRVCLAPGEALYLGPGMLHAYLRGTAVEVMGNSDNTLRCGLTPKYVSREELMTVVSFEPQLPEILRPEQRGAVGTYASPTPFFSLSVLDISGQLVALTSAGPEIFLVTEGQCTLHAGGEEVSLTPGRACFVPAITEALEVTGEARVFRASSSD
jgi:mannose-6-phosphate isomerase